MNENIESKNISQLLKEADELIQTMEAGAYGDLQDTKQIEFEAHAQKLKEIRAIVQARDTGHSKQEMNTGADGMHRAIDEIVKSMQELTNKFF